MRRTLLLSLLVVGAAAALAIGSYSALAGSGPAADVASAVVGSDDPDDGDGVLDADDGDDVDGQDGDTQGAEGVAQAIADTFGVSQEEVLALHEDGIGFGAIFKLYLLAAAGGTSVDGVLATIATNGEEGGFAFGKLFKEMADEVSALSEGEDGMPKNLGQLVSGARNGGKAVAAAGDDEEDGGPPEHAPAHGRR